MLSQGEPRIRWPAASTLAALTAVVRVVRPVVDRLFEVQLAVPNLDVEAAFRVRANPRLELNGSPLAPEIGKRDQVPIMTFAALWKLEHATPPTRARRILATLLYLFNPPFGSIPETASATRSR